MGFSTMLGVLQKREKGLEIGNYTSQMFANIYLNEVDQYIKQKLMYLSIIKWSIFHLTNTKGKRKMNLCFLIGKICSEIQFEFILNSKDISIAMFNIELLNGSIIKVKSYNETADYCYANLEKEMILSLQGSINSKMEFILEVVNII